MGIKKAARSKFDKHTSSHVPRFDHFCVWLNQSVGLLNYKYFLLFLIVHDFMLAYGCYAVGKIIWIIVDTDNLLNASFVNSITGIEVKASYFVILQYMGTRCVHVHEGR